MTPEEQAAEDERARAAALASMASIGNLPGQTRDALAPATGGQGFDSEGMGPISIEPSSEPDPQANTDLTSGTAGVDGIHDYDYEALPREDVPIPAPTTPPDPNAETYGMATDQDATYAGSMRDPGASALASPVIPPGPTTSPAVTGSTPQGARMDPATAVPDRASALASPVTRPGATGGKPPVDAAREAAAGPLPGIDQGLPSEADIAGARNGDIGRRILHALGSGLMVAGGRSATPFESAAEPLEAERRAGIREALQRKGVMRGQEQTQEAQSARQIVQQQLAERQAAQRDRGLDLQEQALPSRIAATEALTGQREASTEHTQMSTEDLRAESLYRQSSRAELERADGNTANAERAAIAARLSQMNTATRDETMAAITEQGDLSTMNAEQLHRIRESLTAGVSLRGGGRGGGGGGRDRPALEAAARELRIPETTITASSDRDLASLVHTEGGQAADAAREDGDGGDRVRVWSTTRDGGEPITADPHMFDSSVEMRNYRNGIASAGDISGHLSEIDRVYTEATGGADDPASRVAAYAQLATSGALDEPINLLLGSLTEMARTGVINPGPEAERLRSMVPDPGSLRQMTFGQFRQRMDQFRASVRDSITRRARQVGVSDADVPRLLAEIGLTSGGRHVGPARSRTTGPTVAPTAPAGSGEASAPAEEATVRVRRPDGRTGRVPASRAASLPEGWERLDGP